MVGYRSMKLLYRCLKGDFSEWSAQYLWKVNSSIEVVKKFNYCRFIIPNYAVSKTHYLALQSYWSLDDQVIK